MAFEGSPVQIWYEAAPVDLARMKQVLHPDVEFTVCEGWPNGGTFHGHAGVLEDFFPVAGRAWDRIRPEIDEIIEVGDTYVVRGRYVGVASETHTPFSLEFVHIWQVRDGKLKSMHQIADTAILADARAGRPSVA